MLLYPFYEFHCCVIPSLKHYYTLKKKWILKRKKIRCEQVHAEPLSCSSLKWSCFKWLWKTIMNVKYLHTYLNLFIFLSFDSSIKYDTKLHIIWSCLHMVPTMSSVSLFKLCFRKSCGTVECFIVASRNATGTESIFSGCLPCFFEHKFLCLVKFVNWINFLHCVHLWILFWFVVHCLSLS